MNKEKVSFMATKTTAKTASKTTKNVVKPAPAKSVRGKKEPAPIKKMALQLPKGIGPGDAVTCIYSKELSEEKGLVIEDDNFYGTFNCIVEEIDGNIVRMTTVYAGGGWPEADELNLETGIDSNWNTAVASISICKVPLRELLKWKKAGEAARLKDEAAEEESPDNEDEEELDEEVEEESEEVEYE
jgi:hypothetical protein